MDFPLPDELSTRPGSSSTRKRFHRHSNPTYGHSGDSYSLSRHPYEAADGRPNFGLRHRSGSGSVTHPSSSVALEQERARAETLERTLKSSPRGSHLVALAPPGSWQASVCRSLPPSPSSGVHTKPYQDVRDQHHRHPVTTSLSVFNSPTATYMWPDLQAASQMDGPPVVYVAYENPFGSIPDRSNVPGLTQNEEHLSLPPFSLSRKRRHSAAVRQLHESDSSKMSGIIEPLKKIHISEPPRPSSNDRRKEGIFHLPPQAEKPNKAASKSPDEALSEGRNSGPSTPQSEATASSPRAGPSLDIDMQPQAKPSGWQQYARLLRAPNGTSLYQCLWTTPASGNESAISCTYEAKKQLVKRHVETTHLKIKIHVCTICDKRFPQKTSLDTHMHGHTGLKPHKCKFDCGEAFSDPARRHRHMVDRHQYNPRQSKKKHNKLDLTRQEPSEYESMQPWPLEGGRSVASSSRREIGNK